MKISPEARIQKYITMIQDFESSFKGGPYSQRQRALIVDFLVQVSDIEINKAFDLLIFKGGFLPSPEKVAEALTPYIQKRLNKKKKEESKSISSFFDDKNLFAIAKKFSKAIETGDNSHILDVSDMISDYQKKGKIRKPLCSHCSDTGLVFTKNKNNINGADTIFNCLCNLSANDKRFKTWNKEESEFYINKSAIYRRKHEEKMHREMQGAAYCE